MLDDNGQVAELIDLPLVNVLQKYLEHVPPQNITFTFPLSTFSHNLL
jgi:hypothetical protein